MKELSIFVDEAGVLGPYDFKDPYYILSFVFHNQENDLTEEIRYLEENVNNLGFKVNQLHAGPIIRRETKDFKNVERDVRKKLMMSMMSFFRRSPLLCKSIYIEKKHMEDDVEMIGRLSLELKRFLTENLNYFLAFDIVKIYYDNGQIPIARMLATVFKIVLSDVEFKKVIPSDYQLFQISDMLCTLKLIELKLDNKKLSKSERAFFDYSDRLLKKHYLRIIDHKTIH